VLKHHEVGPQRLILLLLAALHDVDDIHVLRCEAAAYTLVEAEPCEDREDPHTSGKRDGPYRKCLSRKG